MFTNLLQLLGNLVLLTFLSTSTVQKKLWINIEILKWHKYILYSGKKYTKLNLNDTYLAGLFCWPYRHIFPPFHDNSQLDDKITSAFGMCNYLFLKTSFYEDIYQIHINTHWWRLTTRSLISSQQYRTAPEPSACHNTDRSIRWWLGAPCLLYKTKISLYNFSITFNKTTSASAHNVYKSVPIWDTESSLENLITLNDHNLFNWLILG